VICFENSFLKKILQKEVKFEACIHTHTHTQHKYEQKENEGVKILPGIATKACLASGPGKKGPAISLFFLFFSFFSQQGLILIDRASIRIKPCDILDY
jgi:hypothetical protein